jgi:Tfp pilus assembly protein PilF
MTPADPDLRASLGDLYAQWGETEPERIDQAAAQYRQAIRMSPNVATYHVALGAFLARQGQGTAAIEALERATALDATYGAAFAYLSVLYRSAERTADADAAEQEAITWGAGDLLGATP